MIFDTNLNNDTRGWVMAGVSGIACIFGACILCVDFLLRLFPGKKDFNIQNSDTFLSSSLSLSFGVMLFSALYNMLPESKNSLTEGGLSAMTASWILILCFLGGVVGIQILSRIFHHFIPSHVVGCEHTHDDEEEVRNSAHDNADHHHAHADQSIPSFPYENGTNRGQGPQFQRAHDQPKAPSESTPLLSSSGKPPRLVTRVSSFLMGAKSTCDAKGPCHGYSDPCGKECFKIRAKDPSRQRSRTTIHETPIREQIDSESRSPSENTATVHFCGASGHLHDGSTCENDERSDASTIANITAQPVKPDERHQDLHDRGLRSQHHHHVPSNAFLSIGLQTSFAIALHKLPEGFITYATNHANPELGFSIFVALFIHNITEGFALALPLFLAIRSRWKAIVIASILGGASQPLGAGIAALWFKMAGSRETLSSDIVYGCMFAITSGIMTSVALQLFSESLVLTHSKTLCVIWAFVGMGILGFSNALTA